LRKLQLHRALRCATSPNFGPCGFYRGDFFLPIGAATSALARHAAFGHLLSPALSWLSVAPGPIRRLLRCRQSAPVWPPATRAPCRPELRKGILWMQRSLRTNLPLKLRRIGNRARQRRDGCARTALQLRTRAGAITPSLPRPRWHPDPVLVPLTGRPDRIRHPSARSAAPDGWSRRSRSAVLPSPHVRRSRHGACGLPAAALAHDAEEPRREGS